eukprot:Gb_21488 [translate_table: standard]
MVIMILILIAPAHQRWWVWEGPMIELQSGMMDWKGLGMVNDLGNLKVVQLVEHMVKIMDMSGYSCLPEYMLIRLKGEHQSEVQYVNNPDELEMHQKDSKATSRLGSRNSSLRWSISRGSSGVGSSHRSYSFSFALPGGGRSCETVFINLTLSFCFSGVISARLLANVATVHSMVGDALSLIVQNITTIIAGLQGWVLVRFMWGFSADAKVMYEEANQVANDVIGSIRTIASFCVEDKVFFTLTIAALGVSQSTSLALDASKTVALVGESGSGKSTVISLLERFCDPDSGHILLDGVKNFKLNVAVETSNAHKFISGLPQGYNTNVGERWVQLSGGQKQHIAMARAILKDPRILLLDEATSALDVESKCIVEDALDHVMVDRSTIVIAHHLSTIKDVDLIAVVKNGVIIEQGKHEELLSNRDGAYASLVKLYMFSS